MKNILIFIISLISGPVGCLNVIGYSGGSLIIYCNYQRHGQHDLYFCKNLNTDGSQKKCVFLRGSSWAVEDRFTLLKSKEALTVTFSELTLQDAGSYQCAANAEWIHDLHLKVNTDPCCVDPGTVIGSLGQTITISLSFPETFQTNMKFIFRLADKSMIILLSSVDAQKGKFSISEDRSSKVLRLRIADLEEGDGGVYSCGVLIRVNEVSYYTLFQKIHLQLTASTATHQATSAEPPQSSETSSSSSTRTTIVIISVSVCVVLLLIGGLKLIYKLRRSCTEGSEEHSKRPGTRERADVDYENDPPGNQNNARRTEVHQNMGPNTPEYLSLDPRTREADSFYHNLNSNTN